MVGEPKPEALRPKSSELRPTREQTFTAIRKSLAFMEGSHDLTPTEQSQLKEIKEVAGHTLDKGHDYEVVTFENEGRKFRTHEGIQVNGLLSYLDRKISSGKLSPDEQKEYEEHRAILRARTREYNRGKRLDPEQKLASEKKSFSPSFQFLVLTIPAT